MSFLEQAKKGCEALKNDPDFRNKEISVVGRSQGCLLARYIIEHCDFGGSVKRYVSIGGPQMGVTKFPHCTDSYKCEILDKVIGVAAYEKILQNTVGPAGYYRDVNHLKMYRENSTFLANLNNENTEKNQNFK